VSSVTEVGTQPDISNIFNTFSTYLPQIPNTPLSPAPLHPLSPGKDVLDKDSMIAESERLVQLAQLQDSIMWLVQYVESFVENLQCDKEVSRILGSYKLIR